ncbi:MAG: bis(5'-nucleosyl)-tetraphosphatase (symmetrical) YqeK [Firmicutes bacterium]|nr:bis(5'-nucleosyl)-tetraphosphatase (symmetrical) YqeK [Bacillota bacterium]
MLPYNVIEQRLQSVLSIERYIHTLGVVKTAKKLAVKYGADVEKAALAALLHDCAKDYPEDMKRRFAKEYHVTVDEYMDKKIDLVHSFLGAEVARREFGVEDEEILDAIRYHTTGKAKMSLLAKIVFTADFIEPNRKKIENLEMIREVSFEDLDKAVKLILINTIEFVKDSGKVLHPLSLEALEYYKMF